MAVKHCVTTCVLFGAFLFAGSSPAQIEIRKEVPPPLSLTIEHLCTATITVPRPMMVYVVGTADEASRGQIAQVTTKRFEVRAGDNRYDASHLPPIEDTQIAPEFERTIVQTGMFPEGHYEILVQLFDERGKLLDDDRVGHEVQYPQVTLISPGDGDTVVEPHPLFQWSISRPLPQLEYGLKIWEIMEGQTPHDASGNVPWFQVKGIQTAPFSYPPEANALEPGGHYCWQVDALVGDYVVTRSDLGTFNFEVVTTCPKGTHCKCVCEPKIVTGKRQGNQQAYGAEGNFKCEGEGCVVKAISYQWSINQDANNKVVVIVGGDQSATCNLRILRSGTFTLVLTVTITCCDGTECSGIASEVITVRKKCDCVVPTRIISTGGTGGAPDPGVVAETGFTVQWPTKEPCKTPNCGCKSEVTYQWSVDFQKGAGQIKGPADKEGMILQVTSRSGRAVIKVRVTVKCTDPTGKCDDSECSKDLDYTYSWR